MAVGGPLGNLRRAAALLESPLDGAYLSACL